MTAIPLVHFFPHPQMHLLPQMNCSLSSPNKFHFTVSKRQFFSYKLPSQKKTKTSYREKKLSTILSTSIWMRFLLKRDCGDHVPFCFITTWTICSSGTFLFWSLSPFHNRTGILRKTTKATIKKHKAWKLTRFLRFNMKNQHLYFID